jgi:hypothetical protein
MLAAAGATQPGRQAKAALVMDVTTSPPEPTARSA